MRAIRRGDAGRGGSRDPRILSCWISWRRSVAGSTPTGSTTPPERAVRAFQQSRGLTVDGEVGDETWRALDAARWRLGQRALFHTVGRPAHRRRRPPAAGAPARDGLRPRPRRRHLRPPHRARGRPVPARGRPASRRRRADRQTVGALRRLGRKVIGGRPQLLREAETFRDVRPDAARQAHRHRPGPRRRRHRHRRARRTAAVDRGRPRVRPRRPPRRPSGGRGHAGAPDPRSAPSQRLSATATGSQLANELGADLLISIHLDGHRNPEAAGVATYHYGTVRHGRDRPRRRAARRARAARDRRAHRHARLPDRTPRPGTCCG